MDEWIQSDGAACYNSNIEGGAISENGKLEIGKLYVIEFTILNMTQGKLILDSVVGKPEYTENGDYQLIGICTSNNLTFIGGSIDGDVFDGCIDSVGARSIVFYTIKDSDGNIVLEQTDETGITASGNNIQYDVDWTEFSEGCYRIYFSDAIDYVSDCLDLKLSHPCSLLLSWQNDESAYGFNYSDLTFEPKLRVKGKKWHPSYPKEKNIFKDSAGNRTTIKSETSKEEILTINGLPEYLHDSINIGVDHDNFYVDGVKYTNEETSYTPKWRKSSQLAPSEIIIIKDQDLKNSSC